MDISLKSTDIGTITMNVGNPPIEFLQEKNIATENENIRKQYALFEIKDSGLILSPSAIENIFNPYFIDSTINKKIINAKLAYSYCYKHIKNLKGNMWIYSKPSQGTMACILLPMEKI